jgi:hypothetical protein
MHELPVRVLAGALVAVILNGCAAPGQRRAVASEAATVAAASASSWAITLLDAQREAERGRHAEADRSLREFAERAAPAPEATETMYWRAVFMLDPGNTAGSPREASGLLAKYLEADVPLAHRTEASILQRIAASLAAPREAAPARSGAADATREAEMKALKDELEQTKAELERIKKRIAPPPTAPPTTPPPDALSPHAE